MLDENSDNPKEHYERSFYSVFDLTIRAIKDRFEQEDFQVYRNLQDILVEATQGKICDDKISALKKIYEKDIDFNLLLPQLKLFNSYTKRLNFESIIDIINFFQGLSESEKEVMSEVALVAKLMWVMPAIPMLSQRDRFPL